MDWLNGVRWIAGLLAPSLLMLAALGCGGSGGGTTIIPPPKTLTLTMISPYQAASAGNNWVPAGISGFTLLANGTGFTPTSEIEWNGTPLATAFGTSTDINAPVTAAMVAAPGTATITVYDPASGAKSGALTFGIASPAAATAGVVQMITVSRWRTGQRRQRSRALDQRDGPLCRLSIRGDEPGLG